MSIPKISTLRFGRRQFLVCTASTATLAILRALTVLAKPTRQIIGELFDPSQFDVRFQLIEPGKPTLYRQE